jgi:hypothetical protein
MDNIEAIDLAENNLSNKQAKHVSIRYHFVKKNIEKGILQVAL